MNIEPCMFCEEPLSVYVDGCHFESKPTEIWISCAGCGCRGPVKNTIKKAIAAWNDVARIVRERRESNDRARGV